MKLAAGRIFVVSVELDKTKVKLKTQHPQYLFFIEYENLIPQIIRTLKTADCNELSRSRFSSSRTSTNSALAIEPVLEV
jgi:hypothetical protein